MGTGFKFIILCALVLVAVSCGDDSTNKPSQSSSLQYPTNYPRLASDVEEDAIVEAAKVRFRPIMMTSLAAWLAMLPMAIGGQGAEANAPLARAIIGGVIAAAALSLIVVPCFYVMFKREPTVSAGPVTAGV